MPLSSCAPGAAGSSFSDQRQGEFKVFPTTLEVRGVATGDHELLWLC